MNDAVSTLPVRLMLVDDHPLVRDGLRARLGAVAHLEVIGEASNGHEALLRAAELCPDVMLVDIGMKEMNGLELTERLSQAHPAIRVLILSMYDTPEYYSRAIAAGAKGYVLKDAGSHEIIAAIDAVAAGGSYYSTEVARTLFAQRHAQPGHGLSEREREVLILLAQGLSNKAIALQLDISVRTAETHRLSVRRKLGIDSAAGLAKFAIEHGWL
ncbi:response regulator transcription factor [Rivihabitans pingtungensis]|jgi:DNA-binding NarL/FixJ family response regulator|uniref:response regulator transcription factor n=1 Tax=Rivihabitans pingtungensis TaxID=1054498 RepID=UPI002352AFF2|nr:response regulator transcription factor [Rivihabitans pingtungensis]MCK6436444.1 response regulator transcription factor [Rivihabitans pingtungensis]HNX71881.1 response regulator transcription factor [Rivihabitans pingtungensis]